MKDFYTKALGLELISEEKERHVFCFFIQAQAQAVKSCFAFSSYVKKETLRDQNYRCAMKCLYMGF
jgi:hypothetical protein